MKKQEFVDWKDVADSYFEKAVSLAVLLVLFAFLVFPEIEVKPFERKEVKELVSFEPPPKTQEPIKPPSQIKKPKKFNIVIDENLDGEDDEELELLDTIDKTAFDPFAIKEAPVNEVGKTSKFVVYDDAPVVIKAVPFKYPPFAKKAGIEGTVILEVEVFADGTVGAVNVIQSLESSIDRELISNVKKFKYKAATSNGKAVSVWITQPFEISLND